MSIIVYGAINDTRHNLQGTGTRNTTIGGKMDNSLSQRSFHFIKNVIFLLRKIPYSKESETIKTQLIRSATSVGANYEEAQGAFSRNDFKYKVGICLRETNETTYWLRIIKETQIHSGKDIDSLIKESYELKNIFGSMIRKMKTSKK